MRLFFTFVALALSCSDDNSGSVQFLRQSEDVKGDIAISHVNIVTMQDVEVRKDFTVIVSNGVIQSIGPSVTTSIPSGTFEIDGSGMFLLPGLIDCHTHVYYEEDLLPFIANGVTTILNMGSPPNILTYRQKVRDGELIGPTVYASAFVDGEGQNGWIIKTPAEVPADIGQINEMGWDFIKVYSSVKKDVFDAIVDECEQYEIEVIGHGVRDAGLKYCMHNGQRMVAHAEEFIYAYFSNTLDETKIPNAVADVSEANLYVTANLSAFEAIVKQTGNRSEFNRLMDQPFMRYVSGKWKNQWINDNRYINSNVNLTGHYAFLKKLTNAMHAGGVKLLVGTDAPFIPTLAPGYSIHNDLRTLTEVGLSPYESLKAATKNASEFLSTFGKNTSLPFGTVEVGSKADLLLIKGNPLESIEHLEKPVGVMFNGRWLSDKRIHELLEASVN